MALLIDAVSWLCLIGGGMFVLVGGVGVVRMPDVFTRLHAVGVADTMGAGLILLALILQSGFHVGAFKLFLLLIFLMLTGPTSTHALAEAALRDPSRVDMSPLPEKEDGT
ncbi:MAG: monovalent cation/H(+) antiporter subunit G [Gammaproteobacteria bacterium]|nr:monovalent cation/H(+) antiporter subunit G [Gammaproteobacteria bacterium]